MKNTKKIMSLITVSALVLGSFMLPCASISAYAKPNETIQSEQKETYGYTDDELSEMALDYYEDEYDYRPEYADVEDEGDGTVTIHIYDIVDGHTTTLEWYTVDRATGKGTNFYDEDIDLSKFADDDSSSKDSSSKNKETFGNYTFSLPDSWGDCEAYEDDVDDAVYYFIGEYDELPMFMVLKETLLDYVSSSELKTLTEEEEYEILEYFRTGVTEGEDFENLTESTQTKIAGNPAITFSFTGEIYGDNDVRISVFVDKEDVDVYCLMLMEEEDADPSYFDDMAKIEKSFKKIGEEPEVPEDLAASVYEALEEVSSYSAESVFELGFEAEDSGITVDMTLIMDHELEATLGKKASCHITLNENMISDYLGIGDGDYTMTNELYIINNGKKTVGYMKEDGEDWEYEELDDDESDLEEMEQYMGHIYSFEFFEMLAEGSIDYEVDPELLEVDADEFYVMEMDLTGDDLKLAVDTQFFLSGTFFTDLDYDDVTAHVVIYINAETLLPSVVSIDMPEVGEQIASELMYIDDAEITTCTVVTEYTGFDEFDEIEAPDMD